MKNYKATYEDKFGIETSNFQSDGSLLKIELRGIEFRGICFEVLEGEIDQKKFEYVEYKGEKEKGDLTNCKFNVEMPLNILKGKNEITKSLHAEIQIGKSEISLHLKTDKNPISNSKIFGYFEDAIIDIQNQLPTDEKIKSCLSCKFSHYSPYGNGMFGYLFCFKKIKEKTNEIESKDSLFDVWELADKENKVFNVQETFICAEHEFITDKDWNYSNWKYFF